MKLFLQAIDTHPCQHSLGKLTDNLVAAHRYVYPPETLREAELRRIIMLDIFACDNGEATLPNVHVDSVPVSGTRAKKISYSFV